MAQMPPVLPPHEEVANLLSDDSEALAMYSENHYVFVDTTVGLSERVCVIMSSNAATLTKLQLHCNSYNTLTPIVLSDHKSLQYSLLS